MVGPLFTKVYATEDETKPTYRIKRITDLDSDTIAVINYTSKYMKEPSLPFSKPSKFDENIDDTISVDRLENGTYVPDKLSGSDKGTISMIKNILERRSDAGVISAINNEKSIRRLDKKPLERKLKKLNAIKFRDGQKLRDTLKYVISARSIHTSKLSNNITLTLRDTTEFKFNGPRQMAKLKRSKRSYVRFPSGQFQRRMHSPRRRYIRFPANAEFPPSSAAVPPFVPSRPLPPVGWGPSSSFHPGYQQQQQPIPPMGHRSPRFVFRDTVEPGTLQAPFFAQNNLQDLNAEDHRGCGVSVAKQVAQRRIVGGDEAGFGSFPWQAYIRIGSSRCGGSLVNRYHVVTAGHCVARASARQVQVTLGDYVINSAVEPLPAYTFGVRKISVHPYFKFTPQADRFDVAVLRLDRPVQYLPHIAPICLPEKGEDFLGQFGWAAGWGALQAGSRLRPKTLQAVDVPVIDNRLCEHWHKANGINVIIYDEMMCAGYRGGGKDSCQGDSGGPLMLERSGRWYLIGIVSAGYSCAQRGQPGIYHRVAYTVDWISYIINS